jgi:DNA-binding NarL/FixJ family response regulator
MVERVIRSAGAAMGVLEAAHVGGTEFDVWARCVCDAAASLYQSDLVGLSILERTDDRYRTLQQLGVHERAAPAIESLLETTDPSVSDVFLRSAKVLQLSAAAVSAPQQLAGPFQDIVSKLGARDAVSMTGNVGRISFSVFALQTAPTKLVSREHALLTRVCLHLEQSLSFRLEPGSEVGVLEPGGRVLHAVASARGRAARERLTRHVRAVEGVRTRRGRTALNAIGVWTALVSGRWGLIERTDSDGRRHYVILENPEHTDRFRALSSLETRVVELSASGLSGKLVAYALGVSASVVSHSLASAALKTGCSSRTELVRVAAMLLRSRGPSRFGHKLTPAERDVLGLVRAGFSNAEIAVQRRSSESTVANQVASLLRKARVPTRRVLASLR